LEALEIAGLGIRQQYLAWRNLGDDVARVPVPARGDLQMEIVIFTVSGLPVALELETHEKPFEGDGNGFDAVDRLCGRNAIRRVERTGEREPLVDRDGLSLTFCRRIFAQVLISTNMAREKKSLLSFAYRLYIRLSVKKQCLVFITRV
jgi:hypothetical protein